MRDIFLNRKVMEDRRNESLMRSSAGGENRARTVLISTTIVVVLVVSSVGFFVYDSSPSPPSPYLVSTLVGNVTDPHPYYNTTNGYVSPNLWNLQKGEGNTTISVYSNSSIHVISNYTNVVTKTANIVGYPSVHFHYGLPATVSGAIADNISSSVSFNLIKTSQNLPVDVSYDIMIQPSSTSFSPMVEIMIWMYYQPYYVNYFVLGHFISISIVNGTQKNITWIIEESKSATNGAPLIRFTPDIPTYPAMSYSLNLSSFISETQSVLGLNLNNDYVQQINIGMEFGFSSFSHYSFSLWLFATCNVNGVKVDILGVV